MNVIEVRRNIHTGTTVHMVEEGGQTFLVCITGLEHMQNEHRADWPDMILVERIASQRRRDGSFSGAIRIS